MNNQNNLKKVKLILQKYDKNKKGILIPVLQEVQEKVGYLPLESVKEISKYLKIPISKIYGVITFYAQFYMESPSRNIIRVCKGPVCNFKEGKEIRDLLKNMISKKRGKNLKFTFQEVPCLGDCDKSPVLMINREIFEKLNIEKVKKILRKL